jgi:hypothetical protein
MFSNSRLKVFIDTHGQGGFKAFDWAERFVSRRLRSASYLTRA